MAHDTADTETPNLTPTLSRRPTAARFVSRLRCSLRRGSDDRQIAVLALPALGALAAEPLYILVDTGIVGHLGVAPLAALALAGAVLSASVSLCSFLSSGSTPKVGRLYAAGYLDEAAHVGRQTLMLAFAIGVILTGLANAIAGPVIAVLGGHNHVHHLAVAYMRIASLGLPFALIAIAGQGYLRGVSRLRLPFVLLLGGNALNAILEIIFVFHLNWGITGSAWATVIAQALMAAGFLSTMRPFRVINWRIDFQTLLSLTRTGGEIFVRTASLYATFIISGAILARIGTASLAAHQIAFQLWVFLALTLDALAIAAQVLVSQQLGTHKADRARQFANRTLGWSVVVGFLLAGVMMILARPIPHLFTTNSLVLREAHTIWPIFALMQPANAAVFALDGILIGAGDTRFLMWAMLLCSLAVFVPFACVAFILGWGITGVWMGIFVFICARLLTCGLRFRSEHWVIPGAVREIPD